MTTNIFIQLCYLVASLLFILGLKGLNSPETARRGVLLAEVGMALAVVGTLLKNDIISYQWIIIGILVGGAIGIVMSLKIPMTKMPERIALSHAFGGLAVGLVGVAEYWQSQQSHEALNVVQISATTLEVMLGALTFTGSLVAFGKLQGFISGKPITFPGQNFVNMAALFGCLVGIAVITYNQNLAMVFWGVCAVALVLGVTLVIPIGGADMPVVICLLNSYAGLAASATGFALNNNVLIISGALDGGSGFILGMVMSKAMNRSFSNVLFGAFGGGGDDAAASTATGAAGSVNSATVEDASEVLKSARSLIVIPGYGMAVSQAQYAVRDLSNALKGNGCDVKYAIHPVAGRMPGHMNVLLAEANVAYEDLYDLDQINDQFGATDVVLVVGANDVVNPAAKDNKSSPIYGMPVFNAEQARTVIVLKRSLNPGFAGIENGLFVKPNTMMVLGDAKKTLQLFVQAMKEH